VNREETCLLFQKRAGFQGSRHLPGKTNDGGRPFFSGGEHFEGKREGSASLANWKRCEERSKKDALLLNAEIREKTKKKNRVRKDRVVERGAGEPKCFLGVGY